MRRLSGYDGEERDRLVRKHREYIAGTLDRDANFGNGDEATLLAPPPPPTTGRRPRMTVSIKPKLPPKKQKKGALKAAEAEEESGQEDDEDYVAEEEVINAEELLLPPNKSARGKRKAGVRKRLGKRAPKKKRRLPVQSPVQSSLQTLPPTPAQTPTRNQSPHVVLSRAESRTNPAARDDDVSDDDDDEDGGLNSDYEGSDCGSDEWFEDECDVPVTETFTDSDSEYSEEVECTPVAKGKRKTKNGGDRAEQERWRDIIDNWRVIEGKDLSKLAHDADALKRIRTEGWETDPNAFPDTEDFPGLVSVAKETNRYYKQKLPERMQKKIESQTGLNKLTLEQIYANERRVHSEISAHEIL
ncbi:hypothetical protein PInf_022416 [Phytophthora infestans]|nr:hypothetical protein PInf_022416 [Phytophthora infestans]